MDRLELIEQMISHQQEKLLKIAQRRIPHLSSDDLLQPQDFPDLESDPEFRFEEGILMGLQSVLAAFRNTAS